MAKPIEISVAAKLNLENQADIIKSLSNSLQQTFSDLDISPGLEKSFDKAFGSIDKILGKTKSSFGKNLFNEKDLKQSATQVDKIAQAFAEMKYKVNTSTAESLGLGTPQLTEARKMLKQIQREKNAEINKSASTVLSQDQLTKYMAASGKGGFSSEASLSSNVNSLGKAAAKAQGEIAALGKELADLQANQKAFENNNASAAMEAANFENLEKQYKNYIKLQKQKTIADKLSGVKIDFRKKEEVIADYGNLFAQNITKQTLEAGDGLEFAQIVGKWMELTPAEIDAFATQNAKTIVTTLQGKLGQFMAAPSQGGKGVHGLENQIRGAQAAAGKSDASIVAKYESTKGVVDAYNNQASNYQAESARLQQLIREATQLMNLSNALQSELQAISNQHAETVSKHFDSQIKAQKDQIELLDKQAKEGTINRLNQILALTGQYNTRASNIYQTEVDDRRREEAEAARAQAEADSFKNNLKSSVKHWMGAQQVITMVKSGLHSAYADIKSLDSAMTEIAVVTDYSVSDLWGKIDEYMGIAKQYGVTTQGVYQVSQLYFQQGLNELDTMAATTETLKMARIAGMDYKDAADGMTVAIRGFNMEMTDAAHVTDVYSKVAAVTASDTQELVDAMSKTASSAASVGSSFENTTAMLAVMVEATRESPQNIGSAMKSIISRYGEMTKGLTVDSEGEDIDYNRVDTALKSVGISLKDAQGQFRDFDEVIFELAGKWDTLDSVTQRYIATIFAGNRQQSRFLALVSNAERLQEVASAAENSEDAGLLQYSKTLESLDTKLNNIKTNFQQFYMDIVNGPLIGGLLDFINDLLAGINKLPKLDVILGFGSAIKGIKGLTTGLIDGFFGKISKITKGASQSKGGVLGSFASKIFGTKEATKQSTFNTTMPTQSGEEKPVPVKLEEDGTQQPLAVELTGSQQIYEQIKAERKLYDDLQDADTKNSQKRAAVNAEMQDSQKRKASLEQEKAQVDRDIRRLQKSQADKVKTGPAYQKYQSKIDDAQKRRVELENKINKELEKQEKIKKKSAEVEQEFADLQKRKNDNAKNIEDLERNYQYQLEAEQKAQKHEKLMNTAGKIGEVGGVVLTMAGSALTVAGAKTATEDIVAGRKMTAAGNVASIGGQITSIAASIHPIAGAVAAIGTAAAAGLAAVITGVSDLEQAQFDLEKANEKSEEKNLERAKANERASNLQTSIDELERLESEQYNSLEAQQAYIDAQNAFASNFPELISGVDAAGNAIINLTSAEIELTNARQAAAQAAYEAAAAQIIAAEAAVKENAEQQEAADAALTPFIDSFQQMTKPGEYTTDKTIMDTMNQGFSFYETVVTGTTKGWFGATKDVTELQERIIGAEEQLEFFRQFKEKGTFDSLEEWQTLLLEEYTVGGSIYALNSEIGGWDAFVKSTPGGQLLNSLLTLTDAGLSLEQINAFSAAQADKNAKLYDKYSTLFDLSTASEESQQAFIDANSEAELLSLIRNEAATNASFAVDREKFDAIFSAVTGYTDEERNEFFGAQGQLALDQRKDKRSLEQAQLISLESYSRLGQSYNLDSESAINDVKGLADVVVAAAVSDFIASGEKDAYKIGPEVNENIFTDEGFIKAEAAAELSEKTDDRMKTAESLAKMLTDGENVDKYNSLIEQAKLGMLDENTFTTKVAKLLDVSADSGSEELALALEHYNQATETEDESIQRAQAKLERLSAEGRWDKLSKLYGQVDEEGNISVDETAGATNRISTAIQHKLNQYAEYVEEIAGEDDPAAAQAMADAYTDIITGLANIEDSDLKVQAEKIIANADLTSSLGIEETIRQLEEIGVDDSVIGPLRDLPVYAENLITQYGSFGSTLTAELDTAKQALKDASEGTDLETAQKIAKKMGYENVTDAFELVDGEWYANSIEQVQEAYKISTTDALDKSLERQLAILRGEGQYTFKGEQFDTEATEGEREKLLEQYTETAKEWYEGLTDEQKASKGNFTTDYEIIEAYMNTIRDGASKAIEAELQYQAEQSLKALDAFQIARDFKSSDGITEDKREIFSMLSSQGLTGYSADDLGKLQSLLGESVDLSAYTSETYAGSGIWSIDKSILSDEALKDVPQQVQNAILGMINSELESASKSIEELGSSLGSIEGLSDTAIQEAFENSSKTIEELKTLINNAVKVDATEADANALKEEIAAALELDKDDDKVGEVYEQLIANYKDGLNEARETIYDLLIKKAYGNITENELIQFEEIGKIEGIDIPINLDELSGKFADDLKKIGKQIVADDNLTFSYKTDKLEQLYTSYLGSIGYGKDFGFNFTKVTAEQADSLAYYSSAMEKIRNMSEDSPGFTVEDAAEIATAFQMIVGEQANMSKISELFKYDKDTQTFGIQTFDSASDLAETIGFSTMSEASATAMEMVDMAFQNAQTNRLEQLRAQYGDKVAIIAGTGMSTFSRGEIKRTIAEAEEAVKTSDMTVEEQAEAFQAIDLFEQFWSAMAEGEQAQQIAQFDNVRESFNQVGTAMQELASGGEMTAEELIGIYDTLSYTDYTAESIEAALNGGSQTIIDSIYEAIVAGAEAGDADAAYIQNRISELRAYIIDGIIDSISSGLSDLSSGMEGTLSATNYTKLIQQYGLSGQARQTSRGLELSAADQQKLISQLYMKASSQGLQGEFGDQLWEVWRDNTKDAFEGYIDIEKAIKAANNQIKELGGETANAAQEAVAYRNALQQARHAAMFDENAAEFAFMEQDATSGLTKNFDKFVSQIDKVKSALQGLKDTGKIGYNDFFNILDYLGESGQWKQVATNMGLAQKFVEDYRLFGTELASTTETIGQIDAKSFASIGMDVSTAATEMADGMNKGLKETARSQIEYLSGIEQMLLALQALEGIGDINLDLGISFESSVDGPVDLTLANISKYWQEIMNLGDADLNAKIDVSIDNKLKELGAAGFNDFFKNLGFGENFDFITAFFGPDGFTFGSQAETQLASQLGQLTSLTKTFTENQWMTFAQDMSNIFKSRMKFDPETGLFSGFDFGEGGVEALIADINNFLANYDFSNVKESLNTALRDKMALMASEGKTEVPLKTSGFTLKPEGDGFKIEGLTEDILNSDAKQAILQDLSKIVGQLVTDIKLKDDGTIDIFGENGLIDTSGMEKINKDFQTVAEASSTLQTAITQISTVASSFQAGSGFQSLADQLNAAADAAKELVSALTGQEIESPDISALQTELAAAQAYLDSLNPFSTDAEGNAIQVDYAQLDAAEDKVKSLQAQLSSLQGPSTGVASGIIGELEKATSIANKLSEALSNNNGTPLEVNFNANDANGQVTTLITNLLQLNDVFVPTITVDMAQAQSDVSEFLMSYMEVVESSDPTVEITAITDVAATQLQNIINLISQINSKTVTITTKYITIGSPSGGTGKGVNTNMPKWTGTVNNVTGSAFANGNVTTLTAGAKLANKTLVGELGPELAVYNGQYHLLGQTGAEFVELPDDALIFNHLQTAGIISGQMKNARAQAFKGRADAAIAKATGSAMATGNITGPAFASGIAGALAAVRRAKSVWQGLLNSLSAADLLGGGGGGGGGGDDNSLKAHIADLQEWYNLSRQIADIEGQINVLLAKRKNITDGHEYLRNLRETQRLLDDQVNTQQDLLRFQELQLQRQAEHINNNKIWSQFLEVDENGLLQYKKGNETNGGKGALEVLSQMNEMSGEEQLAFVESLGWSYTNTDGEELENEELVAKFYEELQKQIDDYDALRDTVQETEGTLADLEEQINEIEREIRDNEIDLSKEIYDIIVDAWKENIENLKEQNDLIKEANEAYANGIQEAIDAERQMYEQNTAISDREQLQRQLALMRRSGGSASEIADLEQQLDDMLKDEYFSNQEKQLETIQKANERQAELLDQQVKIQEEMLKYQQENGVIWQKVYEVMSGTDAEIVDFMMGNSTKFFEQSALQQGDMLTEWAKKIGIYTEDRQRQNYTAEAEKTFNSVWDTETGKKLQEAYNRADSKDQQTWKQEYNDTYASKRLEGMTHEEASKYAQDEFYEHIQNWLKAEEDKKKQNSSSNDSINDSNNSNTEQHGTRTVWQAYGKKNGQGQRKWGPRNTNSREGARKGFKSKYGFWPEGVDERIERYAKGGIIDKTGLAWVDGSKSKPERILSAEQNKILEEGLAMAAGRSEVLKDAFNSFASNLGASIRSSIANIVNNTTENRGINIESGAIVLQVQQLNDQYDIDELYNDITNKVYSIAARASGRGVNRR